MPTALLIPLSDAIIAKEVWIETYQGENCMRNTVCVLTALLICLSIGALAREPHAPITILGNDDFTAANGVLYGTGTLDDPYIIAAWKIDVPVGTAYGIKVENASAHFVLRELTIDGAREERGAAIRLGFVSAATIENCLISNTLNGVAIISSTDVVMRDNSLQVTGIGLSVIGAVTDEYRHTIDETNLLNGYPINYFCERNGERVSGLNSNNLYIAACENMTITDNEIIDGDGIQLAFVSSSLIDSNVAYRNCEDGISLYWSNDNTITDNELGNNQHAGIQLWLSNGNKLSENRLLANSYGAIVSASDNNYLYSNAIAANPIGIELNAGSTQNTITGSIIYHENTRYGIIIHQAVANHVEKNAIVRAEIGIVVDSLANNNTISANTIIGGDTGFVVRGSYNRITQNMIAQNSYQGILFPETYGKEAITNNRIFENTFTDNAHHVYLCTDSNTNLLYENMFFGEASELISDYGSNTWTSSGVGNFWEDNQKADIDGNQSDNTPVFLSPVGVQDAAPLLLPLSDRKGLGILTTLKIQNVILLTEKGDALQLPVLIADKAYERFTGFRSFPASLVDNFPAILFYYDEEVAVHFTMETVSFPLDIVFFDGQGMLVGSATMEPESPDLYTANEPFRYALELPGGYLAEHEITAATRLIITTDE